jgi:hypothetical protein
MPEPLRPSFIVLACAMVMLLAAPLRAQPQLVTIAWDPSPDPTVIGYVVYVGTEPQAPRESFEVSGTSFVYPNAESGRPYFFSVAAYSAGPLVGSRSEEILFLSGEHTLASAPDRSAALTDDESRSVSAQAAAMRSQSGPSSMELIASVGDFGRIDSLKALGDGRLILIENGSGILIVNPEGGTRASAALATEGVRLMSLAVDPQFAATHVIYVAEAETAPDGAVQVDVARYREVDGRLGERAVVISGLPGARDGNAAITLDASGHLFAALPRTESDRVDSYAGMVLRFRTNGTVPPDNRAASPLFAHGVSQPDALEWESSTNSLWLADAGPQPITQLRRVRLDSESTAWPRDAEVVELASMSTDVSDPQALIVAGKPHELFAITDASAISWTTALRDILLQGEPTAAVDNRGELDVAVQNADANSIVTTRILRLRPASRIH